jgi:hypothetical protein
MKTKTKSRLVVHGDYSYSKLPDSDSRDVSTGVWKFSRYLNIFIYLFGDFPRNRYR